MTSRTNPDRPPSAGGPDPQLSGSDIVTRILQEAQAVNDLPVTMYDQPLVFKYRKLPWGLAQQLVIDAWETREITLPNGKKESQRHYNVQKFIQACFEKMFMTADLIRSQPIPLSPQVVRALSPEVGKQFAVVFPSDTIEEEVAVSDDAKKEWSDSSEEES